MFSVVKKYHVEYLMIKIAFIAIILGVLYFSYHLFMPVRKFVDINIFRRNTMQKIVQAPTPIDMLPINQTNQLEFGQSDKQQTSEHKFIVLEKFVDALPLPAVAQPVNIVNGVPYYEISMTQFKQKLHRDLPETTLWGYNGTYPGPTIEAQSGNPITVKWINNLPNKHLFSLDKTIDGIKNNPEVRTVVHLHGGHVPSASDGWPEDWFTSGNSATYDYPNNQAATTLWFHDHAMGATGENVYAGLAAFYLIRDKNEQKLNLPAGNYEVPIVIQDKAFNEDGSLYWPDQPKDAPPEYPNPSIAPEFFGDTILVNGKVWPYLEVEPRKYRLRILNGSNARFYHIRLSNGQTFTQIGSEGGLFNAPVIRKDILLAPAERADVILDFTGKEGQNIIITNDAETPYDPSQPLLSADDPTAQIMQFKVARAITSNDLSVIPKKLNTIMRLSTVAPAATRTLPLLEMKDSFGRLMLSLDGKMWSDPISETPKLNTTEVWQFVNSTPDTHPIHLHLVEFQVVDRRPFDLSVYEKTGKIVFTGKVIAPDDNEMGWKDTVRANPGEVTRIVTRFTDYRGKYVWHCHILEHEDYMMMRPYEVK
jgi:spore coat protein A